MMSLRRGCGQRSSRAAARRWPRGRQNAAWANPSGLNERLRLLRYRPGDRSEVASTERYRRRRSSPVPRYCAVYTKRADNFEGGATLFEDTADAKRFAAVAPARGRVVLFEHDSGDGAPVRAGTKLVLRTDVLFDAAAPSRRPRRPRASGRRAFGASPTPSRRIWRTRSTPSACWTAASRRCWPGPRGVRRDGADAPGARLTDAGRRRRRASALPVAPANTRAVVTYVLLMLATSMFSRTEETDDRWRLCSQEPGTRRRRQRRLAVDDGVEDGRRRQYTHVPDGVVEFRRVAGPGHEAPRVEAAADDQAANRPGRDRLRHRRPRHRAGPAHRQEARHVELDDVERLRPRGLGDEGDEADEPDEGEHGAGCRRAA